MPTKRREPAPIEAKEFGSVQEIESGISKLKRRIGEIEQLDVSAAVLNDTGADDVAISNVRETIREVFGSNSPEFKEHGHIPLWAGPMSMRMSKSGIVDSTVRGCTLVKGILNGLIGRLREKMEDLGSDAPSVPSTMPKTDGPIFIGHGGSPVWKDLKDFLVDRLGKVHEEYNREPTPGRSTKERLLEMLDAACFAFLVMTAEDEHGDGKMHARANVIHEAGLFQGRYGFERAIILLEEGCEEFSNVHGLGQIRFPKGNIAAKFEEIRRVLERENLL